MEREERFLMGGRSLVSDRGVGIHLNYYLTEKKGRQEDGVLYGIRIEKIIQGEKEETETEQTPAISASRQMVEQMVGKLMDGQVTPVCMIEILDDLMG